MGEKLCSQIQDVGAERVGFKTSKKTVKKAKDPQALIFCGLDEVLPNRFEYRHNYYSDKSSASCHIFSWDKCNIVLAITERQQIKFHLQVTSIRCVYKCSNEYDWWTAAYPGRQAPGAYTLL